MTREEFEGVWALLAACREGDPRLQRRELRRAWWLVLEPYDAEDVKQAVLGFVREKNQFPFVGEITQRLPPLPQAATSLPADGQTVQGAAKPGMSRSTALSLRWDAMMEAKGYPLLGEWLDRGKPADEWWLARAECQLEDEAYMVSLSPQERANLITAVNLVRSKLQCRREG